MVGFFCRFCPGSHFFHRKIDMIQHRLVDHESKMGTKGKCFICHHLFPSSFHFMDHMEECHPEETRAIAESGSCERDRKKGNVKVAGWMFEMALIVEGKEGIDLEEIILANKRKVTSFGMDSYEGSDEDEDEEGGEGKNDEIECIGEVRRESDPPRPLVTLNEETLPRSSSPTPTEGFLDEMEDEVNENVEQVEKQPPITGITNKPTNEQLRRLYHSSESSEEEEKEEEYGKRKREHPEESTNEVKRQKGLSTRNTNVPQPLRILTEMVENLADGNRDKEHESQFTKSLHNSLSLIEPPALTPHSGQNTGQLKRPAYKLGQSITMPPRAFPFPPSPPSPPSPRMNFLAQLLEKKKISDLKPKERDLLAFIESQEQTPKPEQFSPSLHCDTIGVMIPPGMLTPDGSSVVSATSKIKHEESSPLTPSSSESSEEKEVKNKMGKTDDAPFGRNDGEMDRDHDANQEEKKENDQIQSVIATTQTKEENYEPSILFPMTPEPMDEQSLHIDEETPFVAKGSDIFPDGTPRDDMKGLLLSILTGDMQGHSISPSANINHPSLLQSLLEQNGEKLGESIPPKKKQKMDPTCLVGVKSFSTNSTGSGSSTLKPVDDPIVKSRSQPHPPPPTQTEKKKSRPTAATGTAEVVSLSVHAHPPPTAADAVIRLPLKKHSAQASLLAEAKAAVAELEREELKEKGEKLLRKATAAIHNKPSFSRHRHQNRPPPVIVVPKKDLFKEDKDYRSGKIDICPRCGASDIPKSTRTLHFHKFHPRAFYGQGFPRMSEIERWLSKRLGKDSLNPLEARVCPHCDLDPGSRRYVPMYCGRLELLDHIKMGHPRKFAKIGKKYRKRFTNVQATNIAVHCLLMSSE